MRQPMKDGKVTISRVAMSLTYPANFMLAVAMNHYPCGYYRYPTRSCNCPSLVTQRYMARVYGPLLDRIDIHMLFLNIQKISYQLI